MIRAIIFDCFGVIITDALQAIRSEAGNKDPAVALEIKDILEANNRGMIDPAESVSQIAQLLSITPDVLRSRIAHGEVKDTILLEYIEYLRHTYKTAMLSNIAPASLERRFSDNELQKHFDIVVTSGEIGFVKPEREAYQIAAERLQVKPQECVFIDDRESFCAAARSAGMQAIRYAEFSQFKTDLEKLLR